MARDEEEQARKKAVHEIGQDLSLLSAAECEDRIAILEAEVARIRSALTKKQASRNAAERFFK
jgi:uncharacterized small protein (DUF1192 family)